MLRHVERVDHGRRERGHARLDGRREPRGPAALRRAEQRERRKRLPPLAPRGRVARVERAHDALHHRQEQRPLGIAGALVLVERVRDQPVLGQVEQRLVRHLGDHDDHRVQQLRETHEHVAALRQVFLLGSGIGERLLPAPAADDHERVVGLLEAARLDQNELMLPRDALPGLRLHHELDGFCALHAVARMQFPVESRVGLRDVARERFRRVRRGRHDRRCGAGRGERRRRVRVARLRECRAEREREREQHGAGPPLGRPRRRPSLARVCRHYAESAASGPGRPAGLTLICVDARLGSRARSSGGWAQSFPRESIDSSNGHGGCVGSVSHYVETLRRREAEAVPACVGLSYGAPTSITWNEANSLMKKSSHDVARRLLEGSQLERSDLHDPQGRRS